jgi:hypothetical protein
MINERHGVTALDNLHSWLIKLVVGKRRSVIMNVKLRYREAADGVLFYAPGGAINLFCSRFDWDMGPDVDRLLGFTIEPFEEQK